MAKTFQDSLIWHMDEHGTTIAELSRATGVSTDTIKKLRTRANASTTAENAIRIAAYYGKTVEVFMRCEGKADDRLSGLLSLLSERERQFLEAQIAGLLAAREP